LYVLAYGRESGSITNHAPTTKRSRHNGDFDQDIALERTVTYTLEGSVDWD